MSPSSQWQGMVAMTCGVLSHTQKTLLTGAQIIGGMSFFLMKTMKMFTLIMDLRVIHRAQTILRMMGLGEATSFIFLLPQMQGSTALASSTGDYKLSQEIKEGHL